MTQSVSPTHPDKEVAFVKLTVPEDLVPVMIGCVVWVDSERGEGAGRYVIPQHGKTFTVPVGMSAGFCSPLGMVVVMVMVVFLLMMVMLVMVMLVMMVMLFVIMRLGMLVMRVLLTIIVYAACFMIIFLCICVCLDRVLGVIIQ